MSLSSSGGNQKLSGDAGAVPGLSLTLNSSLVLGFECAPLATGTSNSFMGYAAGRNIKVGSYNTVFGYGACQDLAGDGNLVFGIASGETMVAAGYNTFVGSRCGRACSTGSNNLALGAYADVLGPRDAGNVSVGSYALAGSAGATAVGYRATAAGVQALALGSGTRATGDGHFNVANRLLGSYASAAVADTTYSVQVDADLTKLTGALAMCKPGSNAVPRWLMYLDPAHVAASGTFADLVLQSANRTLVRFTDEFWPGIFDFTGQHRCAWAPSSAHPLPPADLPGRIVVATGRYRDLDGGDVPHMDEAVPVVAMCDADADPRVFGVISALEPADASHRQFRLGNLCFGVPRADQQQRVIVNAAGEGAVWVCDANGPLRNGDLIVSSAAVPGMGMRQHDPQQLLNTTVAKITCDCDFAGCHGTTAGGRRFQLVGCTYK
jgi:hypothetical protein